MAITAVSRPADAVEAVADNAPDAAEVVVACESAPGVVAEDAAAVARWRSRAADARARDNVACPACAGSPLSPSAFVPVAGAAVAVGAASNQRA